MSEEGINYLSTKLIKIIDDTIQILIDDFDLMDEEDYEEPSEINAEEILYDVIKVLEDCGDPEACLEMIVPVIGALQKYMINLGDKANIFLVQLFLHLTQTCLTGIKGEYVLPKSIIKHIMEVIIEKLPKDEGLIVERAFLLGALVAHCTQEDLEVLDYLSSQFLIPMLKLDNSDDILESITGCLTDASGIFKDDFKEQQELIETLIQRTSHSGIVQQESLFNALGDIALSGGLLKEYIQQIFLVCEPIYKHKNVPKGLRTALIQMHTCIFNFLNEDDSDFNVLLIDYVQNLTEFVVRECTLDPNKQTLKDSLSLLLDVGVLYSKSDIFDLIKEAIWNERTVPLFGQFKQLLTDSKQDQSTFTYFNNVFGKIFREEFENL